MMKSSQLQNCVCIALVLDVFLRFSIDDLQIYNLVVHPQLEMLWFESYRFLMFRLYLVGIS